VPIIGVDGKLPSSILPTLTNPHTVFPIATTDELVTLQALLADEAILPDGTVYTLIGPDPTVAVNWALRASQPGIVYQVCGQDGPSVSLTTSDIPEGSRLYYTDARVNAVVADQVASNVGLLKADGTSITAAVPGTDFALPSHTLTLDLPEANWVDGEQTVADATITTNLNGLLGPAASSTQDQYDAFLWAGMQVTDIQAGALTITCRGVVPTIDVSVDILV
jgi:hypothetical protein